MISLESTITLILKNNIPHESTLEITPFEEEEDKFLLRLYQLEQRLVILISTFLKLILYNLCKFEIKTNQRIIELEKAQECQKCYFRMLEKWTVEVQLILEQLTKKLTNIQIKEQKPGEDIIYT